MKLSSTAHTCIAKLHGFFALANLFFKVYCGKRMQLLGCLQIWSLQTLPRNCCRSSICKKKLDTNFVRAGIRRTRERKSPQVICRLINNNNTLILNVVFDVYNSFLYLWNYYIFNNYDLCFTLS